MLVPDADHLLLVLLFVFVGAQTNEFRGDLPKNGLCTALQNMHPAKKTHWLRFKNMIIIISVRVLSLSPESLVSSRQHRH